MFGSTIPVWSLGSILLYYIFHSRVFDLWNIWMIIIEIQMTTLTQLSCWVVSYQLIQAPLQIWLDCNFVLSDTWCQISHSLLVDKNFGKSCAISINELLRCARLKLSWSVITSRSILSHFGNSRGVVVKVILKWEETHSAGWYSCCRQLDNGTKLFILHLLDFYLQPTFLKRDTGSLCPWARRGF